jgi:peptidoglycan/LPS O-acetylase OafA/YrhL
MPAELVAARSSAMDPASPLPAIAAVLIALASAFLLSARLNVNPQPGRYASIDGLRGYLAFFVFLHHACIWYFYLKTGRWEVPPSNLYTQLGQASVALFFMITGFLFFSKLIDGRTTKIDWPRLFISRFLRIAPLYLFVTLLLFIIVAYLSKFQLHESLLKISISAARWLSFTVSGNPNLNNIDNTFTIVAGVFWSLPYEWLFYFSLPLLAIGIGADAPRKFVILSACAVISILLIHPNTQAIHLHAFLGGILAALLVRIETIRKLAKSNIAALMVIACLVASVEFYPSAYQSAPRFLLALVFIIIACGNTLFGILTNRTSRTLGEMAYSIYLLHGLVLFVSFNFVIGLTPARELSAETYWLGILIITPILLTLCAVSFKLIEQPAMRSTSAITAWWHSREQGSQRGRTEPNA